LEGHVRITLLGLAAIAIILAGIAFAGPLFISTDSLRAALFAQVESATGYRLRVSGPVQVSLIPSLDLVAKDVGVAQAGNDASEIATAKSLRFGLELSALFGGKVKVTEVTLIDPVIAVPQGMKKDQGTAAPQTEKGSAVAALRTLSLDALHIENGTLILRPSGGAPGKRIEALNLEAALPSIDAPFAFEASAVVDGKKAQVTGSIGGLGGLIGGRAVPVGLTIDAPSYLDSEATLKGVASYKGESLALSQFTFRAGGKALSGSASYKGSLLTLHPLTLTLGGNTLSGSVAADLSGAVPAVNAAFTGEALNLDTLLSKQGATAASIGKNKQGGWSDDKLDFAALRGVTARFKLSANQLTYSNIKIARANLQATVKGGKLAATLPKFNLYNGAGTLNVTIDASGKVPAQRVQLSLVNFDGYPFLKDATGFESIEGTGAVSLDLAATGSSQRAMVSALSGAAKIEFTDGAIRGINIAKTMRNLSTGILSGWQESAAEKTDFATLGASFKIAKGQATTSDLQLAGPLVRMTGAGVVDLPAQTLKIRTDPKLVASLEGQGGKADLAGLGVPVMVSGPWSKPSIYPDIEGILQNPVAAYEQLNRLGGGLVSLPGAAGAQAESGIGALIKNGKIAPDALQSGAAMGLGQLLGAEPQTKTAPPPGSAAEQPVSKEPVIQPRKAKKRQARTEAAPMPEAVAGRALQSFFGN
jgi:AsmA protein